MRSPRDPMQEAMLGKGRLPEMHAGCADTRRLVVEVPAQAVPCQWQPGDGAAALTSDQIDFKSVCDKGSRRTLYNDK